MSCGAASEVLVPYLLLETYRGDSFFQNLEWQDDAGNPIDLTGYSARMQIRRTKNSTDVILELTSAGYTEDASDPPVPLTSGIKLGGVDGTIGIVVMPVDAEIDTERNVYDVELTDTDGKVSTIVGGDYIVDQDVTR